VTRLERCIDSFLENYEAYGMVNHSGVMNLPGRESVDSIVHGLEELLFPGFLENISTERESLRKNTAKKK